MLFDQVEFALGRKENVTSLKYLFSRSGHTFRMFTTSSATSSSFAAVFKPSRKCRRVRFPPLSQRDRRERGEQDVFTSHSTQDDGAGPRNPPVNTVFYVVMQRWENFTSGQFPSQHRVRCSHGLWGSCSPSQGLNFTPLLLRPAGLPQQSPNPCPLRWKHRVLTTGPSGQSHSPTFE